MPSSALVRVLRIACPLAASFFILATIIACVVIVKVNHIWVSGLAWPFLSEMGRGMLLHTRVSDIVLPTVCVVQCKTRVRGRPTCLLCLLLRPHRRRGAPRVNVALQLALPFISPTAECRASSTDRIDLLSSWSGCKRWSSDTGECSSLHLVLVPHLPMLPSRHFSTPQITRSFIPLQHCGSFALRRSLYPST
jgi:hypothetical protein